MGVAVGAPLKEKTAASLKAKVLMSAACLNSAGQLNWNAWTLL